MTGNRNKVSMFYKLWKVNFVPIAPYVPISDMVSRNLKKKKKKGGGHKTIADTNYFNLKVQCSPSKNMLTGSLS